MFEFVLSYLEDLPNLPDREFPLNLSGDTKSFWLSSSLIVVSLFLFLFDLPLNLLEDKKVALDLRSLIF